MNNERILCIIKTQQKKRLYSARQRKDENGDDIVQEESKETVLNEESVAKYTIKDSVFTSLFQDKKYLIQLYRALLYLVQSYQHYFEQQDADLYSSKKVKMPEPEVYVIFTGERKDQPKTLSLSEEFFNGKECAERVSDQP